MKRIVSKVTTASAAELRSVRAEVRKIAKMHPDSRDAYLERLGQVGDLEAVGRAAIAHQVFRTATSTADEFCRYELAKVDSWVLPLLRELVVKPLHGGPMSITKLRAVDARIRREAKTQRPEARPAIGRAGI